MNVLLLVRCIALCLVYGGLSSASVVYAGAPLNIIPGHTKASAPSGAGNIESRALTPVSPDNIGISLKQRPFNTDTLWHNTQRYEAEWLLAMLPAANPSPVLRSLQRNLLITGSLPPIGEGVYTTLLPLRLMQLIAMKDYTTADALYHQVPRTYVNDEVLLAALYSQLRQENYASACTEILREVRGRTSPIWRNYSVLCHIISGDYDKAELSIALLKEEGNTTPDLLEPSLKQLREQQKTGGKAAITSTVLQEAITSIQEIYSPYSDLLNSYTKMLEPAPEIMKLITSNKKITLDNQSLASWWMLQQSLSAEEQAEQLIRLYFMVESEGYRLSKETWRLLLYRLSSPPRKVVIRYLAFTEKTSQPAEILALCLIAAGADPIKGMADEVMRPIITALRMINLQEYTALLLQEQRGSVPLL